MTDEPTLVTLADLKARYEEPGLDFPDRANSSRRIARDAIALIEEEHRRLRAVIQETDDALVMSSNHGVRVITNEVLRALEAILKEFER